MTHLIHEPADRRPSTPVVCMVAAVRLYQLALSWRPSPCRFTPSCSVYTVEALERFGAWRGLGLSLRRLSRCHPWGGFGADPVPEEGSRTS